MSETTQAKHPVLRFLVAFFALMAGTLGITTATVVQSASPAAATDNNESVQVGMLFGGKWAYNANVNPDANGNYSDSTSSHPTVHSTDADTGYLWGDWATDLYAGTGTEVKLKLSNPSGVLSLSWGSGSAPCTGQVARVINVSVDSVGVGSIYFTHLTDAASTATAPTNGMVVGKVATAGCNPGPHVHFELKNSNNRACYQSWGNPGASLAEGAVLGWLGANNAGIRQTCSGTQPGTQTSGTSGNARLVGDVNGDGKADAVVMYRSPGNAYVALSDYPQTTTFVNQGAWAIGHSPDADRYMLGDVNGDGWDDLVAFYSASGRWTVSLSSSSGFWPPTDWAASQGQGTVAQWVADVDDDDKADAITFDGTVNGDWRVSLSDGNGFVGPPTLWRTGHGVNSTTQAVADFNGDSKADAGIYVAGSESWYVGLSAYPGSTTLGTPGQWSYMQGSGRKMVGDINGGGKADTAYYYADVGHIDASLSTGTGFAANGAWAHGHGLNPTEQYLADVTGDDKADFIFFDAAATNGDWYVSISSGTGFYSPTQWIHGHGAGS
ncbi:MAG TPA: VCBS repeat-containing protein [Verrucomicrobiae bacterium]|nr:VCBS repeat-containing protein [Verrucomicrobiae bacterium]